MTNDPKPLDPTPLNWALRAVTNDLAAGIPTDLNSGMGAIANRWADIVGTRLSTCSLPGSFVDGVLTIHAIDPGAASLVRQASGAIATQANSVLRVPVSRIRVVVSRNR